MHYRKYLRCFSITVLIALSSSYAKGGCLSSRPLGDDDSPPKDKTPLLAQSKDSNNAPAPVAHYSLAIPLERNEYMGDFGRIVRIQDQKNRFTSKYYGPSFLGIFFPKNNSVIYLHYISERESTSGVVSAIEVEFSGLNQDDSRINSQTRTDTATNPLNVLQRNAREALQEIESLSKELSKALATVLKMQGSMSMTATTNRSCKAAKINVINFGTIYLASGSQTQDSLKGVHEAGGRLGIMN